MWWGRKNPGGGGWFSTADWGTCREPDVDWSDNLNLASYIKSRICLFTVSSRNPSSILSNCSAIYLANVAFLLPAGLLLVKCAKNSSHLFNNWCSTESSPHPLEAFRFIDEFGAEDICRVILLEIGPGEGLLLALLATLWSEQGLGVESYLTTEDCDWDGVAGLSWYDVDDIQLGRANTESSLISLDTLAELCGLSLRVSISESCCSYSGLLS